MHIKWGSHVTVSEGLQYSSCPTSRANIDHGERVSPFEMSINRTLVP